MINYSTRRSIFLSALFFLMEPVMSQPFESDETAQIWSQFARDLETADTVDIQNKFIPFY